MRPRPLAALALSLPFLLMGCFARPAPLDSERVRAPVDAAALRRDIAALSADEMEGRAPGTRGDARARAWLIERLEKMGLEAGGPQGGFEQHFDIVGVTATPPSSWSFHHDDDALLLSLRDDFMASSGVQAPRVSVEDAELVFVGYGIQAPEYDWDDYKGRDLRGKVLLFLNNDPDWSDDLFEGKRRLLYGRWTYKYEIAAQLGAAGAIIIHTVPSAGYPWQVVQTSWGGEQIELPATGAGRSAVEAWLTEAAARRLLASAGHDFERLTRAARSRDFEPVALGIRTSIAFNNRISRTRTANVLAVVPGRDAALKEQVLVYSAHHDHIGRGGEKPDRIYNGALDNASGVAQLLAIAEAIRRAPLRRSVLFAFVAAEESGLLGSAYYAQNPTVPAGQLVANINYDGGNIWGRTRDVTMIGFGKSSLDEVVVSGAALQGRRVQPDQFPDRGFFYRSDQFNFARIGVPAIYLDTGTDFIGRPEGWGREQIEAWEAEHYHQVSDELQASWNFEGMVEDVQLGLYCGAVIGNRDALPVWNPGDEFEAARSKALEALRK